MNYELKVLLTKIKLFLYLSKHHVLKMYGEGEA
jgi:hypothetical protein